MQRFGLHLDQKSATNSLSARFLSLLENYNLDMAQSFRHLANFTSVTSNNDQEFSKFLDILAPKDQIPHFLQSVRDDNFIEWFREYEQALTEADEKFSTLSTTGESSSTAPSRAERIRRANPRFVLRQWVLEEVIERMQSNNDVEFLEKVLKMCELPFEKWGEDGNEGEYADESRRLCGTGPKNMLGFQCSCSS